jgi:hypothetical protein
VLEITPETVLTQAIPPTAPADARSAANPSEPAAIALVEPPVPPRPPAPASPGDGLRGLLPWIMVIQGVIVGGLFASAILRRRR